MFKDSRTEGLKDLRRLGRFRRTIGGHDGWWWRKEALREGDERPERPETKKDKVIK